MSFSLHPHPVGIKWYTEKWRANKELDAATVHKNFEVKYTHAFHRRLGRFFYAHRAGPVGTWAPLLLAAGTFKVLVMAYGSARDTNAAVIASAAYGTGGHKANPTPK